MGAKYAGFVLACLSALVVSSAGSVAWGADCKSGVNKGGYGSLKPGDHPNECWRPYSSSASPFNWKIPDNVSVHPDSIGKVERLTQNAVSGIVRGDFARDYGVSLYFAKSADPTNRVECTEPWGPCELETNSPIPFRSAFEPSGVWPISPGEDYDSHLTIVDQSSGVEHDVWNVQSTSAPHIVTKFGGETRIDQDGLGADATAAQFGALGGLIRVKELLAGRIDHALSLTVGCTNTYTYPATKGALECSESGLPGGQNALQNGELLQLNMNKGQIDDLGLPKWQKAIYQAWSKYGAYVGDTTGDTSQWAFKVESPRSYTSFGQKDPLEKYAKDHGFDKVDYNNNCDGCNDEYWFNLDEPVLDQRLRVIRYEGPRASGLASGATAAGAALGTPGAAGLDPDFGDEGIASVDLSDPKEQILDTAQDADGSVLALVATDLALVESRALVRYEADGDVEEVFPLVSRSDLPGSAGALSGMNSIHVGDSGAIYLTGTRLVAGPPELRAYSLAMRILPSGVLDESFGGDGIVVANPPNSGYSLAYDSAITDDRLYLAGAANISAPAGRDITLTCIELDTGDDCDNFGAGGMTRVSFRDGYVPEEARGVDVDSQGRIVVAARVEDAGTSDLALMRFATDGELDPTFAGDGIRISGTAGNHTEMALDVDPEDRPVVAASDFASHPVVVERYSEAGDLDAFGSVSTAPVNGDVADLVADEDAVTLAWVEGNEGTSHITRWLGSGELDDSWGDDGTLEPALSTAEPVRPTTIQRDPLGNLLVAGSISRSDHPLDLDAALIRLDDEGELVPASTEASAPLSDSERVIQMQRFGSGYLVLTGPAAGRRTVLAAFNGDGSIDESFGDDGVLGARQGGEFLFTRFAIDAEGRIIVMYTRRSDLHTSVSRLTPDGEVDDSFGEFDFGTRGGNALTVDGNTTYAMSGESIVRITDAGDAEVLYTGPRVSDCFSVSDLLLDQDGRLVWACGVQGSTRVYRHLTSGAPDPSYGQNGRAVVQKRFANDVELALRGNAVRLAFTPGGEKVRIARLGAGGVVQDITNYPELALTDPAFALIALSLDESGRAYLIESLTSADSPPRAARVARILPSGEIDQDYGGPSGFTISGIRPARGAELTGPGVLTFAASVESDDVDGETDTGLVRILP